MSHGLNSIALIAAATLLAPVVAGAQAAVAASSGITGSIVGTVTAASAAGPTIKVANTLVELWTTDATTEATRDSACAMWLADKSIWMQAKGEAESPSGVNWTGTAVGNDLRVLRSLYALRRDTVRTNADGEFTFASVPFGAYTIDAESFANDKFLQWTTDAPVIPPRKTRLNLDSSTLTENQYCAVTQAPADSSRD